MAEKDMIIMNRKEIRRLHVIRHVIDSGLSRTEAARLLNLSKKQIGRIARRVKEEGSSGICHRSRGKASTRSKPAAVKLRVLRLYQRHYAGDGPTFASEKLAERHQITISDETLRLWLRAAEIPYPRRRKRPHRQWRARKQYLGELVQMDGSHHDWFSGRRPPCVLMGYIDDATGRAYTRFYEYEGTLPAMDSLKRYIRAYGIPQNLYLDKHSTYKSLVKMTIEEELSGAKQQSQFERACAELGIGVIHAHSPQAKGRIERLFRTLQDRLVKELRIREISTIAEANQYLDDSFLNELNQRFQKQPTERQNLHVRASARQLERILCVKTAHVVRNDHTIAHDGMLYQIDAPTAARTVVVEGHPDGSQHIYDKSRRLPYHRIETSAQRTKRVSTPPVQRLRRQWVPSSNHPWRKSYKPVPRQIKRITASP